ncbi:MAG: recombination-associated protein RdgC [Xanthomonadales bacterium]|nr:recombination-associated protein RdgC [Xanthomonadales bacterium]
MFRNIRLYRTASPWPETEEELSQSLGEQSFVPCGAFSEKSGGWEAPTNDAAGLFCRRLAGADLLQLRTQTRVLPASAVKEALEARVAEYRERMSQDPPRSELRRLKEQTRDELVPKSLVKSDRIRGFYLQDENILGIETATPAQAEWFIDHLRKALGRLHCSPLAFEKSPLELLSKVFMGRPVARFELGRECRMQGMLDNKSIVTWRDLDLDDDSIRHHLTEGMQLTHLGLSYDSILALVLSTDCVISKFKFFEGEAVDTTDDEDPIARQDADFILMTGSLKRILQDLSKELGAYAAVSKQAPIIGVRG